METKGVKTIFDSLDLLKKEHSLQFFKIDFYGPIEKTFKDEFDQLLNLHSDCCSYCGYLNIMGNPDISYPILSEYDAMLFPSFYKGEGFPGVILDAYIAGLPVIASDWNMNSEVVKNGETGIIVPADNPFEFAQAMIWMMMNKEKLQEMKIKSNELAYKYDVDTVLDSNLLPILHTEFIKVN
jgi:glycosyltransferase involved in cell wall biosynthesis